jgi:hypothetical protein
MTSNANPPEIVRKSEENNKSGERYQKQFRHFCEWKSENNVKKITVMLVGLFFILGLNGYIGVYSVFFNSLFKLNNLLKY